jgi:hypothetical protein
MELALQGAQQQVLLQEPQQLALLLRELAQQLQELVLIDLMLIQ